MRVLVTGASGFLGTRLCPKLAARGHTVRKYKHDLTGPAGIPKGYDAVIHCAARCGSIGRCVREPAQMFRDNMLMGLNVLHALRHEKCKVLMTGTVCSYPASAPTPLRPESMWDGEPEPGNGPYGIAKRALITAAQAYRQQYGLNTVTVIMANLYGPSWRRTPINEHVIHALFRQFSSSADRVVLWGDGTAKRDFLYVDDAVDGIITVLEKYDDPTPINLGGSGEVSINELAGKISSLCGFTGTIEHDLSKPSGKASRVMDDEPARALGWSPKICLDEGLQRMLEELRKL